ncbi:MAG: hypothetical protein R3F61_23870 [Myxococcota bacterium]
MIVAFLMGSAGAAPPSVDVGLATSVTGPITWKTIDGECSACGPGSQGAAGSSALVPFSKVRSGDILVLPEGALLELVYFDDGHSETFAGPLELVVGGDVEPLTKAEGDALVGEALRSLPGLMRRAELDKGGHTLVRGTEKGTVPLDADELAEIAAARKHYEAMRVGAVDGDVRPEIYLATVQLSFGQTDEATAVLEGARARCASCAGPSQLLTRLTGTPGRDSRAVPAGPRDSETAEKQ